jgi:hypothetical protein
MSDHRTKTRVARQGLHFTAIWNHMNNIVMVREPVESLARVMAWDRPGG